jgi:hypothetical protein
VWRSILGTTNAERKGTRRRKERKDAKAQRRKEEKKEGGERKKGGERKEGGIEGRKREKESMQGLRWCRV